MTEKKEKDKKKDLQETLAMKEQELKAAEDLKFAEEELLALKQDILKLENDIINESIKRGELGAEEIKLALQTKKANEQTLKTYKEQTEEIEKQKGLQKEVLNTVASFGKGQQSFLDKLAESKVSAKDLGKALKEAAKNVPQMLATKAFHAVQEQTLATAYQADNARASYVQMTGSLQASIGDINDLRAANQALTPTMGELYEISGALTTQMSSFSTSSKQGRDAMTEAALGAQRLGVNAGQAGQAMDIFRTQMAMSGAEAGQALEEMNRAAMGMKIPPGKLMADFVSTAPQLAAYGDKAKEVFMGLARQSKALGIEMGKLISFTEQFDTFEGASKAAGQLNAMLGGNFLDSMRLMTAETKEQQIEMVRNAVIMSGKSFDAMSRHEKMYLANAAGISDYSEAVKMFSESQRASQKDVDSGMVSQERMREVQQKSISAMAKFTALGQSIAVAFEPFLSTLHFVADGIASLPTWMLWAFGAASLALGVALGVVLPILKLMYFWKAKKLMVDQAANIATMKDIALTTAQTTANTANTASEAANTTTKVAAAGANQALGASGIAAAPGLIALGAALIKAGIGAILFGAGVALAGLGIWLVVTALIALGKFLVENIALLPQLALYTALFALSLYLLAGGFALAALAAGPFMLAMGTMALGLPILALVIGGSLLAIGFGGIIASVGIFLLAAAIGAVADELVRASGAITSMSDAGGVKKFVEVVEQIEQTDVDNLGNLMDEADRYVKVQRELATLEAVESVASGISKLTDLVFGKKSAAAGENKPQQIIELKLDKDTFATAVSDIVKEGDLLKVET